MKKQHGSRRRALLSSVAMLLVAMVALGSATYAWFTNSTTAKVSGIDVKVNADSGLLISTDGTNWGSIATLTVDAAMLPSAGYYEVDEPGISFLNANLNADSAGAGTLYTTGAATQISGSAVGHYVAVPVWAKLVSAGEKELEVTNNIVKAASGDDDSAFLSKLKAMARMGYVSVTDSNNVKGVQTGDNSAETIDAIKTAIPQASPITTVGFVATANVAYTEEVAAVAANTPVTITEELTTTATQFMIYIWVEGQDTNCTPTANGAMGSFEFNLAIK